MARKVCKSRPRFRRGASRFMDPLAGEARAAVLGTYRDASASLGPRRHRIYVSTGELLSPIERCQHAGLLTRARDVVTHNTTQCGGYRRVAKSGR